MKFEIGKTYTTRCFGDHNLTVEWTVIHRTNKFVTVDDGMGNIKRTKISLDAGNEIAQPEKWFSFIRA